MNLQDKVGVQATNRPLTEFSLPAKARALTLGGWSVVCRRGSSELWQHPCHGIHVQTEAYKIHRGMWAIAKAASLAEHKAKWFAPGITREYYARSTGLMRELLDNQERWSRIQDTVGGPELVMLEEMALVFKYGGQR